MTLEHAFTCPYCWETITMLIEPLAVAEEVVQEYVEDCEVCCNPILVRFSVGTDEQGDDFVAADDTGGLHFTASRLEQ